jgi:hypothetical protein
MADDAGKAGSEKLLLEDVGNEFAEEQIMV